MLQSRCKEHDRSLFGPSINAVNLANEGAVHFLNPTQASPTVIPTTTSREQERWAAIVRDAAPQDLPYKIKTNDQGQIILSPHSNRHSFLQDTIQQLLRRHTPDGSTSPEFAIATPRGVKSPDVAWISPERRRAMQETGDPTTIAPEICVEVLSESNTSEEMDERALYREAGAEEIWLVDPEGRVRFFDEEEMDRSQRVPEMPIQV